MELAFWDYIGLETNVLCVKLTVSRLHSPSILLNCLKAVQLAKQSWLESSLEVCCVRTKQLGVQFEDLDSMTVKRTRLMESSCYSFLHMGIVDKVEVKTGKP